MLVALTLAGIVAAALPPPDRRPAVGAFELAAGRAGEFEVGMSVDEAYQRAGHSRVRLVPSFPEGMFQPRLEIRLSGFGRGPALVAEVERSPCLYYAMTSISVYDPRFRTKNGLGVGSTWAEIKHLYREAAVVGMDTDTGPTIYIRDLGLALHLDPSRAVTDATRVEAVGLGPASEDVMARRCSGK
jgi:hypothetical protein